MDWLTSLHGKLIALDTAPIIYFIEQSPVYLPLVEPFFEAVDRGDITVVTSTLSLLEVLVQPLRQGDAALATQYRSIHSNARGMEMRPLSAAVAEAAAQLREAYNLKTPDAIQLATAMSEGASAFLTNDLQLPSLSHIELLVLDKLRQSET